MDNQRQYPRTPLKCRIRISHPLFGELMAQTRDLSDTGVYVKHPELTQLPTGSVVTGQVQDLPIDAPILQMEVVRVDAEASACAFSAKRERWCSTWNPRHEPLITEWAKPLPVIG